MILETHSCVLNGLCLDYKTEENWFLDNVGNCKIHLLTEENVSCYNFTLLEKETNLSYCGKVYFVNQRLKGLELSIADADRQSCLRTTVKDTLGDADVVTADKSYYFFNRMKYCLMENGEILLIEFHKEYKKRIVHMDNLFKLFRVYKLRGSFRYFGLAGLLLLTLGYSYNVYKAFDSWMDVRSDFYMEEMITQMIFVLPLLLWTIRNLLGLYNLEYSHLGKRFKNFCDGTDRKNFYRNLYFLNKELKTPEYKDGNIRITRNFVCVRESPLGLYVVVPKKNILETSYGIMTMRTKAGNVTHPCVDFKAADGVTYKYVSKKKERMDMVKALIK